MKKATRRNSNKTKLVAIVTKTKIIFMKRIPKNAITNKYKSIQQGNKLDG
ncbi:hypothetical protein [Streptococcus sp.]